MHLLEQSATSPPKAPFANSFEPAPTKKPKYIELGNWWMHAVEAGKRFLIVKLAEAANKKHFLKPAPVADSFVLLPLPPIGGLTSRFTNNV